MIQVDGCEIPITANLAEAFNGIFKYVRERNLMLWADGCCINQADVHERSRQVRLMNSIYRSAEIVVVWLGLAADGSDLAFDNMKDWKDRYDELKRRNGGSEHLTQAAISADDPVFFGPADSDQGRVLAALPYIWRRPWWERAWIVQEGSMAHPSRTIIFCGSRSVDWIQLRVALAVTHYVTRARNLDKSIESYFQQGPTVQRDMAILLEKLRIDREAGLHIGLLRVLQKIRPYKCADPRDKVYAALGMAMDVTEDDIIPDYTKSLETVYREVVEYYLSKQDHTRLDFLGEIWRSAPGTSFEHEQENALPSWIPDWTFQADLQPLEKRLDIDAFGDKRKAYNASGPTSGSCFIDGRLLRLKGSMLDRISWVSSLSEYRYAEGGFETERSWSPKHPDDSYVLGGTRLEAFNHTLVADIGRLDLNSSSKLSRGFALDWDLIERDVESLSLADRQRQAWMIVDTKLMTVGRCLFETCQGFIGLGPPSAKPGDEVCVLLGGQVLYVLRLFHDSSIIEDSDRCDAARSPDHNQHEFIGECYVHGMMDGQACKHQYFSATDIVLV